MMELLVDDKLIDEVSFGKLLDDLIILCTYLFNDVYPMLSSFMFGTEEILVPKMH